MREVWVLHHVCGVQEIATVVDAVDTEPHLQHPVLDTLVNVAFTGKVSPGVYIEPHRDYNGFKGVTVMSFRGRHDTGVVRGFIPPVLCEQPCHGM